MWGGLNMICWKVVWQMSAQFLLTLLLCHTLIILCHKKCLSKVLNGNWILGEFRNIKLLNLIFLSSVKWRGQARLGFSKCALYIPKLRNATGPTEQGSQTLFYLHSLILAAGKKWYLKFIWAKISLSSVPGAVKYSEMSSDSSFQWIQMYFSMVWNGGKRLNFSESWCPYLWVLMIASLDGKMPQQIENLFTSSFTVYAAFLLPFSLLNHWLFFKCARKKSFFLVNWEEKTEKEKRNPTFSVITRCGQTLSVGVRVYT